MTGALPRPLTAAESAVLQLLLSVDFPGAAELRVQAGSASVVGGCTCGCPSIAIEPAEDSPEAPGFSTWLVPAEGVVKPVGDGLPGGGPLEEIILFADDGRLSYLEYLYYDTPPAEWPAADRISVIVRPR